MTDYLALALKYGGFTSLDVRYLDNQLKKMTDQQKLDYITPPPSVINAYFAELYQKKSPEAATTYFLELTQSLKLFNTTPSFTEEKPFIRLNLSGKSYGFCYEHPKLARIFPECSEQITSDLLFEIAQIFPHYLVFEESDKIYMQDCVPEKVVSTENVTNLTELQKLEDGRLKLLGYNQEELVELSQAYNGRPYYRSENRTAMIYMA
ncbi:Cystathionine beta-lyase [Streptococcus sp. DD10]|uniref:cystathionine beta-lyase n=1 Tax=Streptococcus sp. DD10 TaxID=1777878 RepID=UPI00079304BF|nr:cystathionine beta-lyase [Streptococcus sp. DD10]KXT73637.1 Cystathionine beta-lyase [Streptococcus sp. DD10]